MRGGRGQGATVRALQWKKGYYAFAEDRWELFRQMVRTLVDRKAKVLVVTQAFHPETAKHDVKDKSGVCTKDYRAQVRRMRALEREHKGGFFFYDYNNMGDNGLTDNDYGDFEHPSGAGATKITRALEQFRRKAERRIEKGAGPEPGPACEAGRHNARP
jgi:hypothetical protein